MPDRTTPQPNDRTPAGAPRAGQPRDQAASPAASQANGAGEKSTAQQDGSQNRQNNQGAGAAQKPEVKVPERPKLASNVELKGRMEESAFVEEPYLIERDGGYIQVPELLYHVAEQANGEQTHDEMAKSMSEAIGRKVSADNIRQLAAKLLQLGVLETDGNQGASVPQKGESRARSPLAVNMKMAMLDPKAIDPITKVLQFLFWPPVLITFTILAGIAQWWLYFVHGVGNGIHDALYTPGLLLGVLAVVILATAFHELGHAAALRYGGGKVGGIGAGLYIVYPAFYTDVTDNYRLPRWSRVRTDLGGIYFNLIFSVAIMALYAVTGWAFLLAVVLFINFEIIHNLLPFVRLDGYWTLADITGIPDFFSHIGPFLRSQLPSWVPLPEGREMPELKTWAKWVFALYILITIPLLIFLLFLMVRGVPRILGTTWDAFWKQSDAVSQAMGTGDVLGMLAAGVQMILLALPSLGLTYTLFNLGKRLVTGLWNWSEGSPQKRAIAGVGTLAAAALIIFLWAPQVPGFGRPGVLSHQVSFQPIQRNERFAVSDVVRGEFVTVEPRGAAVGTPTPTPQPGAALTGTPGAGIIPPAGATATAQAGQTATVQAGGPTGTPNAPTATSQIGPTSTPSSGAGAPPTATSVPAPTNTPASGAGAPAPTATTAPLPTSTPVAGAGAPPTATSAPAAAPTNTAVPPPTATIAAPTATPVPQVTATPTATATAPSSAGSQTAPSPTSTP